MADQGVDLTNCDREPIHIPGSIQPHGCMLVCDHELMQIRRASANAEAMLQFDNGELVGKPLAALMAPQLLQEIAAAADASESAHKAGLLFGMRLRETGLLFDVAVHRYKGNALIELEPAALEHRIAPLDATRRMIATVSRMPDLPTILTRTPRILRSAFGYDRVMIYQFAEDGSGKVVGEAKRSDLEGFYGQHFPASDIPQQARALYLQNTIRVVSDASGAFTPIHPVLDASGEPLDMSFARLRSVSPIHCEYLRNMGVGASMSISIIIDGALWGLIACHHYAPRSLSLPQCVAAEMFGEFFSLQLAVMTQRMRLESASRARRTLDQVMRDVAYHGDIIASLQEKLPEFSALMPCDGVGLWINGVWSSEGVGPPQRAHANLIRFLGSVCQGRVWASHQLSAQLPEATAYADQTAGVLAIPLSQNPRDYLIYFRREQIQSVEWAGSPDKVYTTGPMGDRLTPRKSFAIWKQNVERQSLPWTEHDREMGEAARTALLEVIMRHSEILETERRSAELRQKLLNEELNHRVKNILALIKSIVAQPVEGGVALADYVNALHGRIMALARAHDQVVRGDGGGPLRGLLEAELSPYKEAPRSVTIEGPSVHLDARAYSVLALVIHELATNAAKYGALGAVRGKLAVAWTLTQDGELELSWRESDGPPVTPPSRNGFGSVLLTRSIPFDLAGTCTIDYARAGVTASLSIPARFVSADTTSVASPTVEPSSSQINQGADGRKVLILEDQLLIAMYVEEVVSDLGAASVDTAANVADAFRVLQNITPDLCILDINLGSTTSLPFADELIKRKIPFVFSTGYGDSNLVPPSMAHVPVIAKPYTPEALERAIAAALRVNS